MDCITTLDSAHINLIINSKHRVSPCDVIMSLELIQLFSVLLYLVQRHRNNFVCFGLQIKNTAGCHLCCLCRKPLAVK